MQVRGKVIVVTGGASGIGAALCRRFAGDGAKGVAVADLDEAGAKAVAGEIGGLAVRCDVRKESDIIAVVRKTEERFGPVDVYVSNAGIFVLGSIETPDADWQKIWEINVMGHVWGARAVVPGMIERGGGSFVVVASAAGLLSQIGSSPYSVTKHASVGFAENLAITYGDQGIEVNLVCPQAVATKMSADFAGGGVAGVDGMIGPDKVADDVVKAMAEKRFLVLPHPEVREYMQRKVADYDRWLVGMRRLQQKFPKAGAH